MAFVVIYDACVLHDPAIRDLLIRVTGKRQLNLRARWSDDILDEMGVSILRRRTDLDPKRLERTRRLMIEAVPDCLVTGYESLIDGLELPDERDRHVLAAAIRSQAQAIVTFNLKDFPASILESHDIEALHPDDFLLGLMDLSEASVVAAFSEQIASLQNPPVTPASAIDALRNRDLPQTADALASILL